jgi:hypothetical protein
MSDRRFKAKRDDGRPLWRVIYDEIDHRIMSGKLSVNDIISHDDLHALLLTDDERKAYFPAVMRAGKELEKEHHRALKSERKLGYRLVGGLGHLDKAVAYRERGRRSINRAVTVAGSIDYGLISAADRPLVDRQTRAIGALLFLAKQHDEKLTAHAEQMKELNKQVLTSASRQTATEEDIAELKRRLAAIEVDKTV